MIATTGFFDGVHTGHRLVIDRLVSEARARGDESLVVTFWPHPRAVLQDGARELRLLTTLEEKESLLKGLGVDRVEVVDFSRQFASLTAEQYLRDILRDRFGVTTLLMGYDNRIGSDRKTASELRQVASGLGMELLLAGIRPEGMDIPGPSSPTTPPIASDGPLPLMWPRVATGPGTSIPSGLPVSSTRIRKALEEGKIDEATEMLGYRYALKGAVVAGNRLGRTIGFPTANMRLYEPLKLMPANGVYAVEVDVLGARYRGMTNIGLRPTVGGTYRTVETHILDFGEDIYGLPLRISFLRRIRDEIRFPSLDALKAQLEKDREACTFSK
ncbi:MAG: bifunctional riboflavin kinase/FMN adenylyltransferase [Bacteroidales bacterium]|nr:bifunctional riboflavin kinase/FMN adenylyltransferase [Bacteroidales bacterium]